MDKSKITALVSALVALVVAIAAFFQPTDLGGLNNRQNEVFENGLRVGLDQKQVLTGNGVLVQGGAIVSLASSDFHLTAAQLCDNTLVNINVTGSGGSNSTTFLPTAATLDATCLKDAGDQKWILFNNNSNDEGEIITLTTNTGLELMQASGSNQVLDKDEKALIQLINMDGSASISVNIFELDNAD